jgi:hypothetical protein
MDFSWNLSALLSMQRDVLVWAWWKIEAEPEATLRQQRAWTHLTQTGPAVFLRFGFSEKFLWVNSEEKVDMNSIPGAGPRRRRSLVWRRAVTIAHLCALWVWRAMVTCFNLKRDVSIYSLPWFFLVLEHYVKLYLKKSQSLRTSHLLMPLWRTKRTSESPYPGDASNVLYFKMATPLPPPEAQLWPRPLWSRISHERNSVYKVCNRYAIGMQ